MISDEQFKRLASALPVLQEADSSLRSEFQQATYSARIPAGRDVFLEGDDVDAIALLLSGAVRVYKIGDTGREITLYRFGLGESCILTANAILNTQTFSAIATVEEDAEAIMIPARNFRSWVQHHELWRGFVFDLLSQRLASVIEIVEEVTFRRMDLRVAALLQERIQTQNPIIITHQEIAAELGSSREVITRILETFKSQDILATGRGTIEVLDSNALDDYLVR